LVEHLDLLSVHHILLSNHAYLQGKLFEEEALFSMVEANLKNHCRSFFH
jgi:hypothetical protein